MNEPLVAFLERGARLPDGLGWLARHPELEVLRRLCRGSRARARVAAAALLEVLFAPDPPDEPADRKPEAPPRATPRPERIASDALAHAEDAALRVLAFEEDIARLAPWVGIGWHREGSALIDVVHDRLDELERLLAGAPTLRAIADLVGRLEASVRTGRGAERGGRESVVGVTFSGELADVLPGELALLSDADTEDLFLMRLAERNLLSLELEGALAGDPREAARRGPALVCVDTSGSMIGDAETLAKAATLGLLRRILGEGRRAEVMLFGGAGARKCLAFEPGRASLRALFDLLMSSYHGGTDFDGPLGWALDRRRAPGFAAADIVLLSDGRGRLHPGTVARLQAERSRPTHPVRLVFVRVDASAGTEPPHAARPSRHASNPPRPPTPPRGRELDPFATLADEVAHVRADGFVSVAARPAAIRSDIAKRARTR